jgi:hypothetical protein
MLQGAVAQLGERLVCNQEATGSIPVSSTKFHDLMNRSRAIRYLVLFGIAWLGSIPWLIYLAASQQVPWWVPVVCAPIYALLFYGVWKTFWPHVRKTVVK